MRKVLKLASIAIIGGASINTVAMESGLPEAQNNQIQQNVVQVLMEEEPIPVITPEQQLEMRKLVNDFATKYNDFISVKEIEPTPEEKQEMDDDGPFFIITINDSQKADEIVTDANNFSIELRRRILFEECSLPDQEDERNSLTLVSYYRYKKEETQAKVDKQMSKEVFRTIEIGPHMTQRSIAQLLRIYPLNLDMDNSNFKITVDLKGLRFINKDLISTIIQNVLRIPGNNIDKGGSETKISFLMGKDYPQLAGDQGYEPWISTRADLRQDTSRFVVLTNKVSAENIWTECAWFNFKMPCHLLYAWARNTFKDLRDTDFILEVNLNNAPKIRVRKERCGKALKDLCATHIMEVTIIPRSKK